MDKSPRAVNFFPRLMEYFPRAVDSPLKQVLFTRLWRVPLLVNRLGNNNRQTGGIDFKLCALLLMCKVVLGITSSLMTLDNSDYV